MPAWGVAGGFTRGEEVEVHRSGQVNANHATPQEANNQTMYDQTIACMIIAYDHSIYAQTIASLQRRTTQLTAAGRSIRAAEARPTKRPRSTSGGSESSSGQLSSVVSSDLRRRRRRRRWGPVTGTLTPKATGQCQPPLANQVRGTRHTTKAACATIQQKLLVPRFNKSCLCHDSNVTGGPLGHTPWLVPRV
jgi:hypothetical protein